MITSTELPAMVTQWLSRFIDSPLGVTVAIPPNEISSSFALCLHQALTHASYANESDTLPVHHHLQRLEFLGDACLGACISLSLYQHFPHKDEGALSQLRATLVGEEALRELVRHYHLTDLLNIGKGTKQLPHSALEKLAADALEAVVGAISLFCDFSKVHQIVLNIFKDYYRSQGEPLFTPIGEQGGMIKSQLQDWALKQGLPLPHYEYQLLSPQGFRGSLTVGDRYFGPLEGSSKKNLSVALAKLAHANMISEMSETSGEKIC